MTKRAPTPAGAEQVIVVATWTILEQMNLAGWLIGPYVTRLANPEPNIPVSVIVDELVVEEMLVTVFTIRNSHVGPVGQDPST